MLVPKTSSDQTGPPSFKDIFKLKVSLMVLKGERNFLSLLFGVE